MFLFSVSVVYVKSTCPHTASMPKLLQIVGLIMVSNVIAKLETFSIANVVESLQKHSVSTLLMSTEILRTIKQ